MTIDNLPVYRLDIVEDEDSDKEVNFVALVDRPAIEKQFLAFSADDFLAPGESESKDEWIQRCMAESKIRAAERKNFAIQDEEERIISGPLMLANKPIFRMDSFGEYYVYFSADTIKKIAQKFFRKAYQNNVNLMHDDGQQLSGLTMFESFITDRKRGILPMKGFEDVPDGSWFGSFKVENDEVWQMVKDGKVKGFSVEGVFNYIRENEDKDAIEKMREIIDILNAVRAQ